MNKIKTSALLFVLINFAILLNTGCKNNVNTQNQYLNFVEINIGFNSRTAAPVLPEKIYYKVSAKFWNSDKDAEKQGNTKNLDYDTFEDEPYEGTNSTYLLKLEKNGYWTFYIEGFKDAQKEFKILESSGSWKDGVTVRTGRYYVDIPVNFISDEENSSSVGLSIDVSKSTVNKLVISGTESPLDDEYNREGNFIVIQKQQLPSGNFDATLYFYKDDVLLYKIYNETINLRKNIETFTWISSETENDYLKTTENSTIFEINPEFIKDPDNNYSCFVKGEESTRSSAVSPSDENTGSFAAPFKTLQKAQNYINALNQELSFLENSGEINNKFTIYIEGTIPATENSETSAKLSFDSNKILSIIPYSTNDKNKISGTVELENINVEAENLEFEEIQISEAARLTANKVKAESFVNKGLLEIQNSEIQTLKNAENTASLHTKENFTGEIIAENGNSYIKDTAVNGKLHIFEEGKVILAGSSIISNSVELEDKAVLYLQNLTTENDHRIATIKALAPTDKEIALVNLNEENQEITFDESFTSEDIRFVMETPGYYLNFEDSDSGIIKGIIRQNKINIKEPIVGGFTVNFAIAGQKLEILNKDSISYYSITAEQAKTGLLSAEILDQNNEILNNPELNILVEVYLGGSSTQVASGTNSIKIGEYITESDLAEITKVMYDVKVSFLWENITYSDNFLFEVDYSAKNQQNSKIGGINE